MKLETTTTIYQIRLQGSLEERWIPWFDGLEVSLRPEGETVLCGALDQAALHGVLSRIRDLGLVLISVQREPSPTGPHQDEDLPWNQVTHTDR